jgi:acyl-CoA hydrolase
MDKASGLFAAVVSAGRAVTATVDKVVFEHPVHIGDAVTV